MARSKKENSSLIWWIVGVLCVFTLGITCYFWWVDPSEQATKETKTNLPKIEKQQSKPVSNKTQHASQPVASSATTTLVDSKIMDHAIPQNETLAKDEMAKLEDIQKQLNDQTSTLKSQHHDADQIIKLKEEQIKLLEAQIAAEQNKNAS